jgi:hypothetical protein
MSTQPALTAPLASVRNRIAEASAALERVMTEPYPRRVPDELGWVMTPALDRHRLLGWLRDLRDEERPLIERIAS